MRKLGLVVLVVSSVVGCGGVSASRAVPTAPGATHGHGDAPPEAPAPYVVAPSTVAREAAAAPASMPAPAAFAPPALAPPAPAEEAAMAAAAKSSSPAGADVARAPTSTAQPLPVVREPRPLSQAGRLTAGVWDDNRNLDFFRPYVARYAERGRDFDLFSSAEISAPKVDRAHTDLDVQLVLDTTGSMGDELSYLQGEFDAIAGSLRAKFPNVTPRWSLVVYRDRGDEYVTRTFDFTTDTAKFRADLRAQSAAGGGDTPEAVVEGLSAGLGQGWRSRDDVAKVAFWVADAPTHPGEGQAFAKVVRQARAKGVHVYPIAASDTDDTAEFQMRSAAQITGGRYVFLTNDSGVGNAHAAPHIPCYSVTRLDQAIVRMLESEMSGRHVEPAAGDVVRAVGRPDVAGRCKLPSGMLVASY